jgi:hypothetical protein
MTLYMSKKGEVGDREYWESELNAFWDLFQGRVDQEIAHRLPTKPANAWERFSKILGLEEVENESSTSSNVSL